MKARSASHQACLEIKLAVLALTMLHAEAAQSVTGSVHTVRTRKAYGREPAVVGFPYQKNHEVCLPFFTKDPLGCDLVMEHYYIVSFSLATITGHNVSTHYGGIAIMMVC